MFRLAGFAVAVLISVLLGTLAPAPANAGEGPTIAVYKSPACGCCGAWVEHLRKNGFDARVHDVPDVSPYKAKYGVPEALTSCH